MSYSDIAAILLFVLCVATYALELYFRTRGSSLALARELIAFIESSGLPGSEKMAYVVEQLYKAIPLPLRTVFTLERLRKLAQEVFDTMRRYALEYAVQKDKAKNESTEAQAENV